MSEAAKQASVAEYTACRFFLAACLRRYIPGVRPEQLDLAVLHGFGFSSGAHQCTAMLMPSVPACSLLGFEFRSIAHDDLFPYTLRFPKLLFCGKPR